MYLRHSIYLVVFLFNQSNLCMAQNLKVEDIPNKHNFELSAFWQSRYVTEGRDNLNGDNLQKTVGE